MSTRPMILKCLVEHSETPGMYKAFAKMDDGTEFIAKVAETDMQLNEPITEERKRVEGWMSVVQNGEHKGRVSITLPGPSLQHGYNVTVSKYDLLPINVSIGDFAK